MRVLVKIVRHALRCHHAVSRSTPARSSRSSCRSAQCDSELMTSSSSWFKLFLFKPFWLKTFLAHACVSIFCVFAVISLLSFCVLQVLMGHRPPSKARGGPAILGAGRQSASSARGAFTEHPAAHCASRFAASAHLTQSCSTSSTRFSFKDPPQKLQPASSSWRSRWHLHQRNRTLGRRRHLSQPSGKPKAQAVLSHTWEGSGRLQDREPRDAWRRLKRLFASRES